MALRTAHIISVRTPTGPRASCFRVCVLSMSVLRAVTSPRGRAVRVSSSKEVEGRFWESRYASSFLASASASSARRERKLISEGLRNERNIAVLWIAGCTANNLFVLLELWARRDEKILCGGHGLHWLSLFA